jgi:hypothetical protein
MNELTPDRTFWHTIGGIVHFFAAYQGEDLPSLEFFGCAESERDLARGSAGYGTSPAAAASAYWNKIS